MRCTVRMGSGGMKKRQQEHTSRVGNAVAIREWCCALVVLSPPYRSNEMW